MTLVVAGYTGLLLSIGKARAGNATSTNPAGEAKVSIVIAAKNEAQVLPRTLDNLLAIGYPSENVEIVVMLDSRDRETIEACSRYADSVRILQAKNDTKAEALNHAFREIRSELILLLDSDSIIDRRAVEDLQATMSEGVAAVGGVPYPTDLEQGILPKLFSLECILYQNLAVAKQKLGLFVQAPGFYSLVRRQSIDSVGGWREDSLAEDYYLSLRMYTRGGRILVSDSRVGVLAPARVSSFLKQRLRWYRGTIDSFAWGIGDITRAGAKRGTDLAVSMLATMVPAVFPFFALGILFWPWTYSALLLLVIAFQLVGAAATTKGVARARRAAIVALTFPYFLLQSLASLAALLTFIFRVRLPWMKTEKSGHALPAKEGAQN